MTEIACVDKVKENCTNNLFSDYHIYSVAQGHILLRSSHTYTEDTKAHTYTQKQYKGLTV